MLTPEYLALEQRVAELEKALVLEHRVNELEKDFAGWRKRGTPEEHNGFRRTGIEKHLSLRTAARMAGIDGKTLKDWMELDLDICFPKVRHGAKLLVLERDVEFVLAKRRDARAPRRQTRTL
jgi:hypothetical protein